MGHRRRRVTNHSGPTGCPDRPYAQVHGILWGAVQNSYDTGDGKKTSTTAVNRFTSSRTIRRLYCPHTGPREGWGSMLRIVELHHELSAKHQITLPWIPAYKGVPGNEAADVAVKKATGWRAKGSGPSAPKPAGLRTLTSDSKARYKWRTTAK